MNMQREGPQCHPDGFELISGVKIPASTFRSEWLRLYEQSDCYELNKRRSANWMDADLRRIIKYQYGRKCTLCKAFIDIQLQCQPHYRPIRLSDVPDPPSQPSDDDDEPRQRPFHMYCWWIYQRDTANKKRRLRYHAKQNPAKADAPEGGAVEQHAPPLAIAAVAAEPLLPPSIDDDAVEQHAPAPQAAAAEQRAPSVDLE